MGTIFNNTRLLGIVILGAATIVILLTAIVSAHVALLTLATTWLIAECCARRLATVGDDKSCG